VEQQDTLDESKPQQEDQPLQSEFKSKPLGSSVLPVPNQQSLAVSGQSGLFWGASQ